MIVQSWYDYKTHELVTRDDRGRESRTSNATLAAVYQDDQWVGDQVATIAGARTSPITPVEIDRCSSCERQGSTKWCQGCVKFSLYSPRYIPQSLANSINRLMGKRHGR